MIRPLRIRHRRMMLSLLIVLPLLFIAALQGRKQIPPESTLPIKNPHNAAAFPQELATFPQFWPAHNITVQVRGDAAGTRLMVKVAPGEPQKIPDALVYWSPSAIRGKQLPKDAFLLGGLSGMAPRSFTLPDNAAAADGYLCLYSLAHRQLIAGVLLEARALLSAPEVAP